MTLLTRRADFKPATFNAERRTVQVVWSAGTGVERMDSRGPYTELLSMNPAHVDLSRLNGASVLDGHKQGGVKDVLGIVERAWIENGLGLAEIRFSERADVQPVVADVVSGILRFVSVGYSVEKFADATKDGARTRTAVKWTPAEISLVGVPADPKAVVRNGGSSMEPTQTETIPAVKPLENRAAINANIRGIAKAANLGDEFANGFIDTNATDLTAVRAAAHEAMISRQATITVRTGVSYDDPATIIKRRGDALYARATGNDPAAESREFMHDGIFETAKALLSMRGLSTSGGKMEVLQRAMHSSGDLPMILQDGVGGRVLLEAYKAAVSPLKTIYKKVVLNDFRQARMLRISELSPISKVNEAGELKSLSVTENGESVGLATWGGIFRVTRAALINDDLGALAAFSQKAGQACADKEAELLTANIVSNPILEQDTLPVFHASHNNYIALGSGNPPDIAELGAARAAMRNVRGIDGTTRISLTPKYLIVSSDLETEGEILLSQTTPAEIRDVNPFQKNLQLIVEPRLPSTRWYLAADPSQNACAVYTALAGYDGPQIAQQEASFDILGMEFRVYQDMDVAMVDHRGLFLNSGA